jgi:hypothetical protein
MSTPTVFISYSQDFRRESVRSNSAEMLPPNKRAVNYSAVFIY